MQSTVYHTNEYVHNPVFTAGILIGTIKYNTDVNIVKE
jgi:hypothetical protein